MRTLPFASRVFVGLGQCGVGVDGREYFVQPQAVPHGQHILGQQVTRMRADNRHAQNSVFAGHRQHLDGTARLAVGDGPVQVVDTVVGYLTCNALLLRLLLVQANSGHLGVDEGGPRNHRIIRLE